MFGKKKETVLRIDGMHCERCAARVRDALEAKGFHASVSLADGEAKVKHPDSVSPDAVAAVVNALGYSAAVK